MEVEKSTVDCPRELSPKASWPSLPEEVSNLVAKLDVHYSTHFKLVKAHSWHHYLPQIAQIKSHMSGKGHIRILEYFSRNLKHRPN